MLLKTTQHKVDKKKNQMNWATCKGVKMGQAIRIRHESGVLKLSTTRVQYIIKPYYIEHKVCNGL